MPNPTKGNKNIQKHFVGTNIIDKPKRAVLISVSVSMYGCITFHIKKTYLQKFNRRTNLLKKFKSKQAKNTSHG